MNDSFVTRITTLGVATLCIACSALADSEIVPTSTPTQNSGCSACDNYFRMRELPENACLRSPTGAKIQYYSNRGQNFKSYEECRSSLRAEWGELGQHCDSYDLLNDAEKLDIASASLFTTSAISCGLICAQASALFGVGELAAAGVCVTSGISALGVEIASLVQVTGKAKKYNDWWNQEAGLNITSGVLSGGVVAGSTATALTGSSASCWTTTALLGTVASLKWASLGVHRSQKDLECSTIRGLNSIAETGEIHHTEEEAKSTATAETPGNTGVASGSLSASTQTQSIPRALEFASGSNPYSWSAATDPVCHASGKAGDLCQLVGKHSRSILQEAGLAGATLAQVKKLLSSGSGPGSVIASYLPAGTPEGILNTLKKQDQMAQKGEFDLKGVSSGAMVASTIPQTATPRRIDFAAPENETSDAVTFSSAGRVPTVVESQGDIWHSNWNGSIFSIIQDRIERSKNQLDRLEWSSPRNRALQGLSNRGTR